MKVLGSEEQDVKMAEDAPGHRETLSVGFLEMTEDLTGRLPVSTLTTFPD